MLFILWKNTNEAYYKFPLLNSQLKKNNIVQYVK